MTLIDVLRAAKVKWAIFPTDWLGIYRILEWTPLSLLLAVTGVVLAFVVSSMEDGI